MTLRRVIVRLALVLCIMPLSMLLCIARPTPLIGSERLFNEKRQIYIQQSRSLDRQK